MTTPALELASTGDGLPDPACNARSTVFGTVFHSFLRSIACALALAATAANATVNVAFVQPARYTDAGDWNHDPRDTLIELQHHLQALGERYLPPGYELDISILDVTLAGRSRIAGPAGTEVRVMSGDADWPRIELSYQLRSGATAVRSERETIADPWYLRRVDRTYASTTPLVYEKRMLDDWFEARFGGLRSPSSR